MFTDIKNFTDRSSRQTRQELLSLLELHDNLIRPIFEKFGGKIIKTVGDAFLVTFESPTDAVLCGIDAQKRLRKHNEQALSHEQMEVRIAINAGEVTMKDGDVFGEAVNITSRIEGIAEPNEIYFTEAVYLSMNKSEVPSAEVGHRHLKGIPYEIKVYKVLQEAGVKVKTKIKSKAIQYEKESKGVPIYKKILLGVGIFLAFIMLANNQTSEFGGPLIIILYIFLCSSFQTIAKKTKTKHTWLAWIPIINILYWVNIAKKPWWWYLLFLIPFVDLIFMTWCWMDISKMCGKSKWLGLLILVPGINLIFVGYMAYSR